MCVGESFDDWDAFWGCSNCPCSRDCRVGCCQQRVVHVDDWHGEHSLLCNMGRHWNPCDQTDGRCSVDKPELMSAQQHALLAMRCERKDPDTAAHDGRSPIKANRRVGLICRIHLEFARPAECADVARVQPRVAQSFLIGANRVDALVCTPWPRQLNEPVALAQSTAHASTLAVGAKCNILYFG